MNAGLESRLRFCTCPAAVGLSGAGPGFRGDCPTPAAGTGPARSAPPTRLESSSLISLSLISLSLSPCSFSLFFSPNRLGQLSLPFLCQPLTSCHLDCAVSAVLHCGLCLLRDSLLRTNNNRKSKKRKYLPVLKWLELMK